MCFTNLGKKSGSKLVNKLSEEKRDKNVLHKPGLAAGLVLHHPPAQDAGEGARLHNLEASNSFRTLHSPHVISVEILK